MKTIVERYQTKMYQVEYEVNFEMMIHKDWVRNNRSRRTYPNGKKLEGDSLKTNNYNLFGYFLDT
jgi:hypothetical protein